jgi:hypothetical protein
MEHKRKNIKDIEVITNCDNLDATPIENRIFTVRGHQIMVDRDLAELYGVDTRSLNQAVKRNIDRFPESFRFQISDEEKTELVANCDRFKTTIKFSPSNPYVFTEQGVAMLSAVLKSETAIHTSIRIIEAFVAMRNFLMHNASIFQRMERLEMKQLKTDEKVDAILDKLGEEKSPRKVFSSKARSSMLTFSLPTSSARLRKESSLLTTTLTIQCLCNWQNVKPEYQLIFTMAKFLASSVRMLLRITPNIPV